MKTRTGKEPEASGIPSQPSSEPVSEPSKEALPEDDCTGPLQEDTSYEPDEDGPLFQKWIDENPVSISLKLRIPEGSPVDLLDVGFPDREPPEYFKLESFYRLQHFFREYLQLWLESCGYQRIPEKNGYKEKKARMPRNPDGAFRAYLQNKDPLLLVALTHMIKLIKSRIAELSDDEKLFFELSLDWIEKILFHPAMTPINWDNEYQELLKEYSKWRTGSIFLAGGLSYHQLEIEISELDLSAEEKQYLQSNWNRKTYPEFEEDQTGMYTLWDALIHLYEGYMQFSKLNTAGDRFRKEHIQFVLQAALLGPFTNRVKTHLARIWLKVSEIDHFRLKYEPKAWREKTLQYTPPETTPYRRKTLKPAGDEKPDKKTPSPGRSTPESTGEGLTPESTTTQKNRRGRVKTEKADSVHEKQSLPKATSSNHEQELPSSSFPADRKRNSTEKRTLHSLTRQMAAKPSKPTSRLPAAGKPLPRKSLGHPSSTDLLSQIEAGMDKTIGAPKVRANRKVQLVVPPSRQVKKTVYRDIGVDTLFPSPSPVARKPVALLKKARPANVNSESRSRANSVDGGWNKTAKWPKKHPKIHQNDDFPKVEITFFGSHSTPAKQ